MTDTPFNDVAKYIASLNISDGKRLRSKLCDAVFTDACEALGVDCNAEFSDFAELKTLRERTKGAIELIHYASLLHDDIMDNAETRRGKKSTYIEDGTRKALISGDVLFANALQKLGEIDQRVGVSKLGVATLQISAVSVLSTMCEAQMQETLLSGEDYSTQTSELQDLENIIEGKTGALFGLAAYFGALFAVIYDAFMRDTANNREAEQIVLFCKKFVDLGVNIGIAYQLRDDIADIAEDSANGTPTVATVFGVDAATDALARVQSAITKQCGGDLTHTTEFVGMLFCSN